jgi:hypothetical protein
MKCDPVTVVTVRFSRLSFAKRGRIIVNSNVIDFFIGTSGFIPRAYHDRNSIRKTKREVLELARWRIIQTVNVESVAELTASPTSGLWVR